MIEAERIFEAREALAETLARDVADELSRAIEAKGRATLAVSGGTTPRLFFEKLSMIDIPWSRVAVTLVDERQVPETSERSNARLVRQHLLQNRAAAARFVPLVDNPDAEKMPAFDVAVLGMGNDTLAEAIDAETSKRLIAITAPGSGEPRLTFTLPVLEQAGRLALHIEGTEKQQVLKQALAAGPEEDMPVRAVLRGAAPVTLYWCP